jgi:AcrR family transcriptional regulator
MPRISLKPRKTPRQGRSIAMVEVILQAATRVLRRESLAGFNTNRVAAVAGISVGSLYQYFPNKAALMAALIERDHARLIAAVEQVLAETEGRPLGEVLRALAKLAVAQQYADPLLAAALDHEERRLPLAAAQARTDRALHDAIEQLFSRHRRELARDLPPSAASDCLHIAKALVESEIGRSPAPSPDLEDRVVRALSGYLMPRP